MNLGGEIGVRIAWDGAAVTRVDVRSTRPDVASSVLAGRETVEAIALVARLFPLCGRAQGIAAALACEAARGALPAPAALAARSRIVEAESVAELLWHELLDAPVLLGVPGVPRELAAARKAIDRAIAGGGQAGPAGEHAAGVADAPGVAGSFPWPREVVDAATRHVFGEDPPAWIERWSGAIDEWARSASSPSAKLLGEIEASGDALGRLPARLLPALDEALAARTIAPAMDANPGFAQAPTWEGAPAETGPVCAHADRPWVRARLDDGRLAAARVGARLLELATLLAPGRRPHPLGALQIGPRDGIAWVRTARGTLIHRVELRGGRVSRWRIVAPTEWNFHPAGALAGALRMLRAGSVPRLERLAALLVHSLDPCVACSVEVGDA